MPGAQIECRALLGFHYNAQKTIHLLYICYFCCSLILRIPRLVASLSSFHVLCIVSLFQASHHAMNSFAFGRLSAPQKIETFSSIHPNEISSINLFCLAFVIRILYMRNCFIRFDFIWHTACEIHFSVTRLPNCSIWFTHTMRLQW